MRTGERRGNLLLKRREIHHLKLIIEGRLTGLTVTVCERLIELGLVRRDGNLYIATEVGRDVASKVVTQE